ncbi:uncharacterized protein LOC129005514 [Macrosteles quadrilineatus]|uniref:uncharacterized protein LOC129005514 n=1 Tax=Macrosteles quadrilineatus TaxID=74068 RepID=UPI0023E28BD2|nr:uncharacterized protein LOC129005514 [Macrosteles quadrilineatus]
MLILGSNLIMSTTFLLLLFVALTSAGKDGLKSENDTADASVVNDKQTKRDTKQKHAELLQVPRDASYFFDDPEPFNDNTNVKDTKQDEVRPARAILPQVKNSGKKGMIEAEEEEEDDKVEEEEKSEGDYEENEDIEPDCLPTTESCTSSTECTTPSTECSTTKHQCTTTCGTTTPSKCTTTPSWSKCMKTEETHTEYFVNYPAIS